MTGRKLLHYEVLEKLGEGGMGVVYKARDTHLGRFVAVKVLSKIQSATPAERQRFYNEAKAASALNHPNIIHIYDIGNDAGVDFIVMEYVSGMTLAAVMRRKGIALSKALRYAAEIADGLNKAHVAGIVHRDLKPSNIMVNDDGVVKLLDFGLAKLVDRAAPSDDVATRTVGEGLMPTREGTIVGTAAYMAPEQAEGKAVDARADVFSFGAVLYEMVSGQRAFPGDSPASVLAAVMTKDPPSLRHTPREIDKVIQRCLKKNPAERWHSMADVKLALQDLQQDYSSRSGELAQRLSRRRPVAIVTALGILILGVLVAAFLLAPRFAAKQTVSDLNPQTLTTLAGSERNPSISPDGSQVAFAWNGPKQDNYDIYIQHINSSRLLRLTDDPAEDDHPAWSPDGRWIAFHRHVDQHKVGLYLVAPLGGLARQIWDADLNSTISWTHDGKWLLLAVRHPVEKQRGIFLFSIDTSEKRQLTSPADSSGDSEASLSPDSRSLAFVRGGDDINQLMVVRLDANLQPKEEPRAIPAPPPWHCHSPIWTLDGRDIVFSGGALGSHSLWRSPADGSGPPQRLAFAGEVGIADLTIQRPSTSSATHRLIYSWRLEDSNIFRLNLHEKTSAPAQVIASTRNDMHAQYSPDGKRIAFESARSGTQEVWVSAADGSNQFALTSPSAYCGSPSWSPDGRTIAYESNADGRWDIYTIGATGENPQRLTNTSEADFVPSWSRDGKWIYFASHVESLYQVFKMPATGGTAVPVTKNGGYMAMEAVDGKSLLYTKDAGNPTTLWRLSFNNGDETLVAAPVSRDSFCPVKEGVYVIGDRARRTLRFFGRDMRASTVIRTFERMPAAGISLSSDGASLLYSQYDQTGSDLMLVENFR